MRPESALIVILVSSVSALFSDNLGFNPYILQYDKPNYLNLATRQRRSANEVQKLSFESHGRHFNLVLKPAQLHTFASTHIELDRTRELDSLVRFYTGFLVDEPYDSHASGTIIDGAFYGTIRTGDGHKYFVESARKFNRTLDSHSIVYREYDVELNKTKLRLYKRDVEEIMRQQRGKNVPLNEDAGSCASDRLKDWMKKEQEALYDERIRTQGFYTEDPYYKYSKEANEPYSRIRHRRDTKEPERVKFPGDRTICNLYLRVDPYLHTEIFNNEGNKDLDKTTAFILFYLNKHVEALNTIYNSLPFYDPTKEKYLVGIQFMIYRTKIITEEQCRNKSILTTEELKLCEPYLDVSTFLNYVSLDNFTDYCLAYTFTARDFTDGTLGLAWVAKLSGSVGGVCEKRQTLQGVAKSLNSGIVTVVNYQARVPEAVSQITFAHEVGHNFGSEHDPDDSLCSPGPQKGGNYIMYRRATTGTDRNNRNFSECSRDQMGPILHALVAGSKFCFKQYNGSLCGNGIVEEGEECDCGYGTDCKETCCNDASQEVNKCKLKPGKQCSPSQGPCCDSQCNFASARTVCMHSTECLENVMCSGRNATCPHNDPTYFKPDKTECNSGTQVCKSGVCSGSICEKYEMQQCFLQGNLKDKKQDKAVLCHLACIGEKTNNMCMDSFEIPEMTQPNATKGLILKPGSPCVGTLGYCDIFSKCRAVDAEGPLARLKNILLNPETLLTIRDWVTTYWWAALLIGIGFIIFMAVFLKVCSVHTPSSNPRKPPALKISDTLRRPIKKLPHIPHPHFRHHHNNQSEVTQPSKSATKQVRSQSSNAAARRSSADKNASRSQSNNRKNSSEAIELNPKKPTRSEEPSRRHLFNKRHHQYVAENVHHQPKSSHTRHSQQKASHQQKPNQPSKPSQHKTSNHHSRNHVPRQSRSADVGTRHVHASSNSKSRVNNHHKLKTSDFISKHPSSHQGPRKRSSTESSSIEA